MEAIKLEDLCPQPSGFTLRKTGATYTMRPITLSDQAWIQQNLGKDISRIFNELRANEISRLVYRLLDDESKSRLVPVNAKIFNDDTGECTEKKVGGWELLALQISGMQELMKILECLLHVIGISQPMIEKFEEDELKKKAHLESVSPSKTLIGETSSISSPTSTGTHSTRSEA